MMRTLIFIGMLLSLGACTAPSTSPAPSGSLTGGAPTEAEQALRPLRQAYALKVIDFLKSDSELSQEIGDILKRELPIFFERYMPNDKDRLNSLYARVVIPEAQRRVQEVKEIFAGVFADLLTTDELKRMADGFSHPSFARFQAKQPLREQDKQELAALRLPELAKRLQDLKPTAVELARVRCELWGKAMLEDLYRRKPELFRDQAA